MDEANEEIVNLDASAVEACRMCLATNIKLHSLLPTHHTCIQSIPGFTKFEGLPNYICYECAPVLLRCKKLLEKSNTAQDTLLEIFNKNGQISKPLIEEQKKTKTNLQSELSSFILLNHDYLFEDDSEISDVKNELDDKSNITLKNEVKEESGDESDSALCMKIIKDLNKDEETSSDSDVEAIDVAAPIIEIESDDEKMGDDFISLKSYDVKMRNPVNDLLAKDDFVPLYDKKKMKPIGLANSKKTLGKKKPKKRRRVMSPSIPTHDEDKFVRRYFNIKVINKPDGSTSKQYFCKYCPEKYNYVDNARDHVIIGCQKNIRSPPELEPAANAISSHPTVWKIWPGAGK